VKKKPKVEKSKNLRIKLKIKAFLEQDTLLSKSKIICQETLTKEDKHDNEDNYNTREDTSYLQS